VSALCAGVSAGVAMTKLVYGWSSRILEDNSVFLEDPGVNLRPGLLSSRKVLVLEDPGGPIFKSSSLDIKSLSLSLKLDSLSLSSSLSLKSLTTTLGVTQ